MAIVKKNLTAVNDNIALNLVNEENGAASFQIPAGAVGTYVLEATLNGTDWVTLQITNMATKTDSASASAPGVYFAEYIGFQSVRVRKTAGIASEQITLSVNDE